jgi:FKBP-type peptidyl-prolyl cis-trans isomerase
VWEVREGDGDRVEGGDVSVVVNYFGWLIDGKMFDSSLDRNEPTKYRLDGQIKGWQEGVKGMRPGGVRRLVVPPELAYGRRGVSGSIPEDTDLEPVMHLVRSRPERGGG